MSQEEQIKQNQQNQEAQEFYSEEQVNGTIISPHGSFSIEYEYFNLPDGRILQKEKKIDLINKDLTSGFLGTEMQVYNFCVADYLSMIIELEKTLGVDLTPHYNKIARTTAYTYALSKSGGHAPNIVKSHFTETKNYQIQHDKDSSKVNAVKGFLGALPKPKTRMQVI